MRYIHLPAALLVLWLLFSTLLAVTAADGRGRIFGQLVFPEPAVHCDNVEVNLQVSPGVSLETAYTDLLCRFEFTNVAAGHYFLHVAIPGYYEVLQPVPFLKGVRMDPVSLAMQGDSVKEYASKDFIVHASEFLDQYPEEAVDLYKQALENHRRGADVQAARQLEEALQQAPRFYGAHQELGLVYRSLGRLDDAESHFWTARRLNEYNADPLIALSSLYLERKQFREAEKSALLATETDQRSAVAFFSLGMARYRQSRFEPAEDAYNHALTLAPDMLDVRLALANVYGKLARFDEMIRQLDYYLANASDTPQREEIEHVREQALKLMNAN